MVKYEIAKDEQGFAYLRKVKEVKTEEVKPKEVKVEEVKPFKKGKR